MANMNYPALYAENPILTPRKKALLLPTQALADAIAQEWQAAGKFLPKSMPLTAMAFAAVDVVAESRDRMASAMLAYAETDLLLYRSETPELAKRQAGGWDPVLALVRQLYDCELETTEGVMPLDQPPATLMRFRQVVEAMDDYTLSGFSVLVQSLGSLLLALVVKERKIVSARAFALSRIDENFQAEKWGEDSLSLARGREIERDVLAAAQFLELARTEGLP